MANLLGELWGNNAPSWQRLFADPRVKLHLYGKREARPGRKMGHFCYLDEQPERALERARELIDQLKSP
jgi:5-(carboxyamino)imidazole ribonucleotide synthase